MSDDTADDILNRIDRSAADAGVKLSPEFRRQLEQKVREEERRKAEIIAQQHERSAANPAPPEQHQGSSSDTSFIGDRGLRRDLRRLGQPTAASSAPSSDQSGFHPPAYTEYANARRAESGPEQKDKIEFWPDKPHASETRDVPEDEHRRRNLGEQRLRKL